MVPTVRTLGRTIADGRGQEDGSLSVSLFLSLRGIVIYDVGVVGRDTVYLPTYLPVSTKFVTLIRTEKRDLFLSPSNDRCDTLIIG